ncbi:hypothetical protein NDI39_27500 [Microcoleus sp. ZQ-A2]|nr:hypothetical protein [Microcoleus sp. FACHB-1]
MINLPDLPDIDADFSEATPDEHLEAIRQEHEPFLTRLEALAVCAIASGDWDSVYDFLDEARGVKRPPRLHRVSLQEFLASTTINDGQGVEEMTTPNAPTNPSTQTESKGL